MGKTPPSIPTWAQTLGGLIDAGATLQAWCDRCHGCTDINMMLLAEKVGRAYSLIDRRCRCRITPGCLGWNQFRYSAAPRSIRWNLRTDAGIDRRIARDDAARRALADGIRSYHDFMVAKKAREQH